MEGVSLTIERSSESIIVETDCAVAARMVSDPSLDRSQVAAMVSEVRHLLASRQHKITSIKRDQNKASHVLAQMGRTLPKTAVWIRCAPEEVVEICKLDCDVSV